MNALQFRRARIALGLTQEKLGKAIEKNPRTIRRYEDGAPIPRTVALAVKALALDQGLVNDPEL